jgi:hypothetical protein
LLFIFSFLQKQNPHVFAGSRLQGSMEVLIVSRNIRKIVWEDFVVKKTTAPPVHTTSPQVKKFDDAVRTPARHLLSVRFNLLDTEGVTTEATGNRITFQIVAGSNSIHRLWETN